LKLLGKFSFFLTRGSKAPSEGGGGTEDLRVLPLERGGGPERLPLLGWKNEAEESPPPKEKALSSLLLEVGV